MLAALLITASLALAGCSGVSPSGGEDSAAGAAADAGDKKQAEGAAGLNGSRGKADQADAPPKITASHIIRTASLTVQVKDVPKALDEARTVTENAGGFVGQETTNRDDEGREHTRVVLRVPTDKYAGVLGDLEGTGKLLERNSKAQDVTDQVVDVESRIKTQRASVIRIRELMDQATKLSDVVTLEGELSSRQADLEALLAQQASLKDRTSLATITLSLTETRVEPAKDEAGFADALTGGWDAFVTMLRWIALAFGAVLPFAATAAIMLLVWVRVARARRPATANPAPLTTAGPLPPAPGGGEREED